jgi:hypothetical protein
MTRSMMILVCGAAVAAAVYGALRLSGSQRSGPADPWIGAFREEGLNADLLSTSTEPGRHFLMFELREKLRRDASSGAKIFEYVIEDVRVQVATFPFESRIVEMLDEGTHPEFRFDAKGKTYHYARIGRHVLVMEDLQRVGPERRPLRRDLAKRILDAFSAEANR